MLLFMKTLMTDSFKSISSNIKILLKFYIMNHIIAKSIHKSEKNDLVSIISYYKKAKYITLAMPMFG